LLVRLAFVTGGGIDTVQTPQLPAVLNATNLVRLLLHRTETNKQHSLDLEITDEDGSTNVHGLQLAKEGRYATEISADNVHLRTLNLRTKVTSPAKTGN
jgi:hypothetical protein